MSTSSPPGRTCKELPRFLRELLPSENAFSTCAVYVALRASGLARFQARGLGEKHAYEQTPALLLGHSRFHHGKGKPL